ncbi:MAG: Uma2 family endonuclease [Planctomycetes bacterium]|nr:Uma2 family endonuclease [Planctomycetota bacterium]
MTLIPPTEQRLPPETVYGRLDPGGPGLTRAAEFEEWDQEDDNPLELIDGWVLPMSPGNLKAGRALLELSGVLQPIVKSRNWFMTLDARHRLPQPPNTVVFPDIAIHAVAEPDYIPGTESTGRVPEIAIEILGKKSYERDMAPRGAKFLAYQLSGVREYYYTWPDGRDASGFALQQGVFVPLPRDPDGFFRSPFLGCSLRLVEAGVR